MRCGMEALASVATGTSVSSGARGSSVGRLKLRLELLHFATATKKKKTAGFSSGFQLSRQQRSQRQKVRLELLHFAAAVDDADSQQAGTLLLALLVGTRRGHSARGC